MMDDARINEPVTVVHATGRRPRPRELAHELRDVAVAVPLALTAPLARPWHARWGATDEEITASLPGDDVVPDCQTQWTRAISIASPPSTVWPWLVQAGFGKAGFYSNDLLDNVGHPSANEVIPSLQILRVGDWVPMFSKVDETTAFRVHSFEPERWLVWAKPDSSWVWSLAPAPDGGTRLVTRLRNHYDWSHPGSALFSRVLMEFGDFPMIRRMLKGIKARAERS
jgi:hypothetical protein